MTSIEESYEKWQKSNNKILRINNDIYYQIVWSGCFKFNTMDKEILCAVLNPDMPAGNYFEDENGNHFTFKGLNHIKFPDKIPEWYLNAGQCSLEWHETKVIGNYLKVLIRK